MKKKILYFITLLLLASCMPLIGIPKKEKPPAPKKFVSVAIFLEPLDSKPKDYNINKKYYMASDEGIALIKSFINPITQDLIFAIDSNTNIIIANSPLVQNLLYLNDKKNIKSFNKEHQNKIKKLKKIMENLSTYWKVYKTKDKQFCIFIKKPISNKINLIKLGLNDNLLSPIKNLNELRKYFATPKGPINSINVETLNNIFKGNIPKFVYITGHGLASKEITSEKPTKIDKNLFEKIKIAQLTHDQNNKFLKKMNKTGCHFLYYETCFIGGLNTVLIDKIITKNMNTLTNELKKDKNLTITFPIVSGGLTDSTTTYFSDKNFDTYFKRLKMFFGKRITKKNAIESIHWIEKPFRNIVLPICSSKLENIPSILFPGLDRPLKTINVDKEVIVLTYPYLIEHELKSLGIKGKEYKSGPLTKEAKEKLSKEIEKRTREKFKKSLKEQKGQKIKEIKEIKEGKYKREPKPIEIGNKKAVLIYPMILHVPLKITNKKKIPKIISMIPGKAYHYIHKIDIGDHDIVNFIYKAFKIEDQTASKLFFIKEIIAKDKNMKSIFVFTKKEKGKKKIFGFIKHKTGNWTNLKDKKMSEIKVKYTIKKLLSEVEPIAEALFAANVRIENKQQFKKLTKNIFSNPTPEEIILEKLIKLKPDEVYKELKKIKELKGKRFKIKIFMKKMFKLIYDSDANTIIKKAIMQLIFESYKTELLKEFKKSDTVLNVLKLSNSRMILIFEFTMEKILEKSN